MENEKAKSPKQGPAKNRKSPKDQGKKASDAEKKRAAMKVIEEKQIDDCLDDSFPASDPPAWTLGRPKKKEAS